MPLSLRPLRSADAAEDNIADASELDTIDLDATELWLEVRASPSSSISSTIPSPADTLDLTSVAWSTGRVSEVAEHGQ